MNNHKTTAEYVNAWDEHINELWALAIFLDTETEKELKQNIAGLKRVLATAAIRRQEQKETGE